MIEARQIEHWIHLFTEEIGEDYVRRVTRIGLEQRERRILPHDHVRAYGRFAGEFVGELLRRSTRPANELADVVATITKLVHFDMAMALRAYEATVLD
ncbi:MAG: protoglobin domain-containing protein [Hyphomicrobiales bacterium]|nr:protoglobin domain-containing protein [Hyphomicrobiales bacterium]